MKVALLLHHFPVRSETFVIQHALALCRSGVDLTIVVEEDCEGWESFDPEVAAELKDRVYILPVISRIQWLRLFIGKVLSKGAWTYLKLNLFTFRTGSRGAVKNLPRWIEIPSLGRFDAILAHFGPIGVLALVLRRAGVIEGPIATVFHGFDMSRKSTISRYKKGYEFLFKSSELMIPISAIWRQKLIRWGAPLQNIEVLHMGVDLPDVPPDFLRRLSRPLRVLSVGRLTQKKAHDDTIAAIAMCAGEIRLDIIGSGELEEQLRQILRSIPNNNIRLLGALPHNDVLKEIANSDLFILPSVTADNGEMEGIPIVLMEAMAYGAIVIATKHSGIPELIVHGETGFLVEEHDPNAIAQIIREIIAGEYDLHAIRRRAYERICAEFSNHHLNIKLLTILKTLRDTHPI